MYKSNKIIRSVIAFAAVLALSACTATIEKPSSAGETSEESVTVSSETAASSEDVSTETETSSDEDNADSAVDTEDTSVTADESDNAQTDGAEVTAKLDFSSVEALVKSMTTEEKIGQMLLARYPDSGAASIMEQYQLGGYTLYAKDFETETPETFLSKTEKVQSAAKIPAFMATDEEGGTVVRVSKFPQFRLTPFSSQIALAKAGEETLVSETAEKAELFKQIGLNLNLAPVADVTADHTDYIYERTFGQDAETTGKYVALTVETMNENGVGSCLKHFPGYGSNVDTHTGIAIDTRSKESFESTDLVPFKSGIEAGAPMIMVNHNVINAYDSELPASLSPAVHELLRDDLGFEGVIVTDDLGMDAITEYSGEESPYVLAVLAGNDLLCTSDIETAYNDILAGVNDGRIDVSALDESVTRILTMKADLNILDIG
jgi:beta-N-acetylhexosaminidase